MAKKLPKQIQTTSDNINRGRQVSRTDDKVRSRSIGILDIDQALFYYFENVIKPVIEDNGEQVKVPVIYANPERWAAIQRQGHIRDNKRKIMTPVISFRRTSLAKDDSVPVDKLDPSNPKLFQSYQSRYTQENRYDKLTALKGISPKKEMFNVAVPDYVTLSYDFIIWTNFTDQMNKIVETINWSEGSYWGEDGKFRFRASIDSFEDTSEYDESRRNIKTNFSVTLKGYLIPDSFNNLLTTQKFITPKQVVITDNTDINILPITDIGDDGEKSIRVVTNLGGTGGGGGGGGSVQSLTLTAGPNMAFDSFIYTGVTPLNKQIKISDTPSFSTLTVTSSAAITGSMNVSASATSSTAIYATNVQNGYPTSNEWQNSLDGSYFNNFDNTTHVSEILRFMAGIISHSLDTASPTSNTKTYGSIDTNENSLGSTDSISGYVPQNFASLNNATLDYLVAKGWTAAGQQIFNGITVYKQNGNSYAIDFDSNAAGSTSISSSADNELFGLGPLANGGPATMSVQIIATHSFSDVSSNNSPNESSNTHTTQSVKNLLITSFGTSNGLTLAKINSSQPAVIPAAFQDGKFVDVGGSTMSGTLTRKYHASETSFTSVSSSGYYRFHGLKVGLATGSGNFTYVNGSTKNKFYAPIDTIESAIGTNTIADSETTHRALTATSRSLSGVPYLQDATFEVSTKITGLFNPMYIASTTLVDMTAASVGAGSVSISGDTVSTNGGTIQTSGKIFQSDGTTVVNSGIPRYNDIAIITGSVSFDSGNNDNINQSGFSDTTFTVATKARNRNNAQSTLDTQTITYHTAGNFGQVAASGSLGIYGRAQGYDGGSLTGTTEQFTGEDFRIALANNVQAFNGTAFTTSYSVTHLGNYDLQIKPGFLVDPGGSYRYWYTANHGSGTYKYYIRRFQTSGTKSGMTINVGKSLVNWNSNSNGVAVALLFKSSGNGSGNRGGAGALTTARIFDPSATTSNLIEANVANDNFKNPFTTAISLYGNTGGGISGNTYTVPLRNADSMFIDNTDNELYTIIRYKGDPTPVTSITISYS